MSGAVERVRAALEAHGERGQGGSWTCPAHEDRRASLSVSEGRDGRAVVHCHAGCSSEQIVEALGLRVADLFPDDAQQNGHRQPASIIETYPYVTEHEELLFEVVRFAPKDFRQRRPDPSAPSGWAWNLKGVPRVLYRLPRVLAAVSEGRRVWICEGEKDVHALERAGEVATCNPGGAGPGKWRSEFSECLRGAQVVIVRDRDKEGQAHAQRVTEALAGIAASVELVEAADGKDPHDHLQVHGLRVDDFRAVEEVKAPEERPVLRVVPADAFARIEEASAEPLLGDADNAVLPAGGTLLVYGKGGAGKTTLELDLALHLAAGAPWLGLPVHRRCRVLVVENEGPRGSFRRKLRGKLDAWQGASLDGQLLIAEEPWAQFTFGDDSLRSALVQVIREHEVDVLAAGPIVSLGMSGGGTPDEVGAFVALVEQLRADLDRPLAVVLVHHPSKQGPVSGAWEGRPDTLVHVRSQGNGSTRLEWEKCRWASALHGMAWKLLWRDGEGFALDETPEHTDEDLHAEILAAVEASPGLSANGLEQAVTGSAARVRKIRDDLLEGGALVNRGGGKGGAGGGGMRLFLPSDAPFVPTPTNGQTNAASAPGAAGDGGRSSVRLPVRRRTVETNETRGAPARCTVCERPFTQVSTGEPYCRCDEDVDRWSAMVEGADS